MQEKDNIQMLKNSNDVFLFRQAYLTSIERVRIIQLLR